MSTMDETCANCGRPVTMGTLNVTHDNGPRCFPEAPSGTTKNRTFAVEASAIPIDSKVLVAGDKTERFVEGRIVSEGMRGYWVTGKAQLVRGPELKVLKAAK